MSEIPYSLSDTSPVRESMKASTVSLEDKCRLPAKPLDLV